VATVGVVKAIITADTTQLKKGMTDAQRSMDRMGKQMSKVGKSMTMKVTMPLVGIGVAAAKMASDFEFSMTQIETLVGRSAKEVETLKGSVLGLSGETGRAPKELADAMFFITSAGLDASSATAALEASAKAAAVGLGDTVVVADAVTNAMNGYGMSAEGAAFATDVLAKTVEQGKASAADLAPQFGRLIPMAAELGISFDQVGGGLAFLTRASGDAAMSATQLGGVMKSFLKPSQQAKKVLEEIGVDLHELRAAASADLLGALQGLREQLEANGFEMSNVFEDIRGLNGALQLTGVATGAAREVFDELADSTGKLDEAFLGVQKTAQFKLSQAMAGMKASMITLGEQVLPVVVPMVAALAGWIGSLATAFGNMEGPAQKVVVIFGMAVAALGPLLMILGSLTTALSTLSVAAGGAAVTLGAVLIPIGLIVAAGVGLFAFFSKMGERSKEARERASELTDAMVEQGAKAPLLGTELDVLIDKYNSLKVEVEEATEEVNDFAGESVLTGLALARGVAPAIDNLQTQFPALNSLIASGTSAFSLYQDANMGVRASTDSVTTALRNADPAIRDVTSALADKIDADQMSVAEAKNVLRVLDQTSTAYRDSTEATMADNRAIVESTEKQSEWAAIVGGPAVQAVLNLAERTGDYNLALATINRMIDHHVGEQERAIAAADDLEAAQAGVVSMLVDTTAAFEEEQAAASLANLSFTERNEVVAAARRSTQMFAESSRDLHVALNAEAIAARDVAQAMSEGTDARARATLSDFKAGREMAREAIYRREVAAAKAEEARIEAEDLKKAEEKVVAERERLQLVKDRAAAGPALMRAERRLAGIERDRLRLIEDIKDTRRDLLRLAERQADVESDSGDWAIRYKRDLASAALSVMSITDRIRELQATEQATSGVPAAKDAVAHLVDVASAVTDVEQALIDMGVITVTQARIADMSAQDAKALVDLNKRLAQTEKEMAEGEVTQLDLWAAMEDYAEAVEDATRESDDLRRARENLSRAEADAIQLEKEQKRVVHELEVAYVDLAEAERTRAGLMDKEATRNNALAEIEEQRADLQRTLEDQNRQLLESGLDLIEAHAGLADAEAEVARTGANVNAIMDAQQQLFDDTDTEVGELTGTLGFLADAWRTVKDEADEAAAAMKKAAENTEPTGYGPSGDMTFEEYKNLINPTGARGASFESRTGTKGWSELMSAGSIDALKGLEGMFFHPLDTSYSNPMAFEDIPSAATGGFVKSAGLVSVHAGETITPRGNGVNVVVNVEGSVTSERELVEAIRKGLLRAQQSGKAVVL
jgi:TP901 family phage tail tape measure protein